MPSTSAIVMNAKAKIPKVIEAMTKSEKALQ
jgi:hypothetical protein